MWRDIRHPRTGRLLFRYDPERAIIQVQERGEKVTVDLQEYHQAEDRVVSIQDFGPDSLRTPPIIMSSK